MRIWLAQEGDAAEVARLMIGFRNWFERDTPPDEVFPPGIERLLADENTDFLLAAVDSDSPPVGVCALRYRYGVWLDGLDCCLEDVFVEESARGTGLGEALVLAALARARERGAKRVELDVNDRNTPAHKLYEKLGFSSYDEDLGGHNRFMRLHL
ncbi:MAG TPA: GNAT family N-acetyltransferase [Thermoleophilaceae bacterium]